MRIGVPRKSIREWFLTIYELQGCQKAVDFLTKYYGIRRMRIVLDGRRVGNGNIACYDNHMAYFTKRGLNKRTVLHELYHHTSYVEGWDMPSRVEEKNSNRYARVFEMST